MQTQTSVKTCLECGTESVVFFELAVAEWLKDRSMSCNRKQRGHWSRRQILFDCATSCIVQILEIYCSTRMRRQSSILLCKWTPIMSIKTQMLQTFLGGLNNRPVYCASSVAPRPMVGRLGATIWPRTLSSLWCLLRKKASGE